jgi:hypothetical protein
VNNGGICPFRMTFLRSTIRDVNANFQQAEPSWDGDSVKNWHGISRISGLQKRFYMKYAANRSKRGIHTEMSTVMKLRNFESTLKRPIPELAEFLPMRKQPPIGDSL